LHYSNFNLDTDYSHYAMARALQGLGYAFFFVPLSVIAYSQLKPNENNKASSLTNFFRNWGGSFGIAFVNTISERRLSFHQERVGSNLPASSGVLQQQVQRAAAFLEQRGFSHADAMGAATSHFYNQLQAQAHLLGFMDCFHIIGILTLLAAPLVLLTRSFKPAGSSSGGH
jgi:DHA2 family multidrug resistance protein